MDRTLGVVTVIGGLLVGGLYLLWRNAGAIGANLEGIGARLKNAGDSPSTGDAIDLLFNAARRSMTEES